MNINASFDERLARSATTIEEAEAALLDFIRANRGANALDQIGKHSHGFDLFLPWFMEVVEYRAPEGSKEALGIPELQQLYMDAAWSLVMKGKIRPGPKLVGDDVDKNVYGKAFTLVHGVLL